MMTKKILFFDIDGTLLSTTTNSIPKSTFLALKKAKENGHLIFINTGRPFSLIDECVKQLNPDGYVCGCGTYIRYHDEILFSYTVPSKRCLEIKDLIRKTNVDGALESKDTIYFDNNIRNPFLNNLKDHYTKVNFKISNFDDPTLSFDKFCVWFDKFSDIETLKKEIANDFDYISRADDFGEIVPKGYSKATGIQFLLDYFAIDIKDTFAFGDSFNDESMLSYVKNAIVMENGDPEIFKLADYITKTVDDDGIYYALKHFNLI